MRKEKTFLPKDMKDLEDITYSQSRLSDKEKYDSYVQNDLSDWQEKEIEKIFGSLGECKRIEETSSKKTFDYKIDEVGLLIEGGSINPPPAQTTIKPDPNHLIVKIKSALKHIEEKDSSEYPSYLRGGVIYCSTILLSLTNIWDIVQSREIRNYIQNLEVDYVSFLPESASIDGGSSRELYRPIIFVKNKKAIPMFKENLSQIFDVVEI